jgi:hypothetical protein
MHDKLAHVAERHRRAGWVLGGYSITSSARASSVGGMLTPSVFAVFRLMTNSNLVGCSILDGLVPIDIQ